MADMAELIRTVALGAVDNGKPVAVLFGTVLSAAPLKIDVEQKMELIAPQLVLCRAVTDHTVEMTVAHETEDAAHTHTASATEGSVTVDIHSAIHRHAYAGRKAFTIHGALQAGERVLLLRMQGGQQFIVVDRV